MSSKFYSTIAILAFIVISTHGCLNPNEKQGSCTQCPQYLVFVEGQCKTKRGCDQITVRDKQVVCLSCQNGFLLRNEKCLRSAQVKIKENIPFNVTDTGPSIPQNVTKLTLQNITETPGNTSPGPSVPAPAFKIPTFPQVVLVPQRSAQLSTSIKKQILQQYPRLFNYKLIQIGQQNSLGKRLLVYEDGTILLVTYPTTNVTNTTVNSTAAVEQLIKGMNADVVNKIKSSGTIVSSSLNLVYNILNNNNQAYTISSDFSTQSPQLIQSCSSQGSQCSSGKPTMQQIDPTLNYSKYIRWSYDQQQNIILSLNLPQKVTKVEAQRKYNNWDFGTNTKSGEEVKFKIYYNWNQGEDSLEENMLITYFVDSNTSAFTGYFSNGIDIFKELGVRQQQSKSNGTAAHNQTAPVNGTATHNGTVVSNETTAHNGTAPINGTVVSNGTATVNGTAVPNGTAVINGDVTTISNVSSQITSQPKTTVAQNTSTPVQNTNVTQNASTPAQSTNTNTSNAQSTIVNESILSKINGVFLNQMAGNTTKPGLLSGNFSGVFGNTTSITTKPKYPLANSSQLKKVFNEDPNYGSNLNSTQLLHKKPPLSSQIPSKIPQIPLLSTPSQLLSLLSSSSQQFQSSLTSQYKTLHLTNQTCSPPSSPSQLYQCYNVTLLTQKQVILISANQSYKNNEVVAKYETINQYSCWNSYANYDDGVAYRDPDTAGAARLEETIGRQLDIYLRKNYPLLKDYGRVFVQNRIDRTGEKYYIVYTNEAFKKVIFQMLRNKKQANNFVLTHSQIFDSGYNFQSEPSLHSMSIKLSQLQSQLLAGRLSNKFAHLQKYHQPIVSLIHNFKNYLQGAVLTCLLSNGTHVKLYISTKFANFQYLRRIGQTMQRPSFTLLQFKNGSSLLPVGFSVDRIVKDGSADDDQIYRSLRQLVINRYKSFFGGSTVQLYTQKYTGSRVYEMAMKTIMGFYTFKATQSPFKTFNLSPMKKVDELQDQISQNKCKGSQRYDGNDNRCYQRIEGCYRQIGSYCLVCYPDFVLEGGKKFCRRTCNW